MRKRTGRHWFLRIGGAILALLVLVNVAAVVAIRRPVVTRWVESLRLRQELEKEIAKSLHFPGATLAPIHRTGMLSARSESLQAGSGWKAMTSADADHITASFNPLGVFLRRWQIDDLHIDRAKIAIQVYEPKPEATPAKPWYAVLLPDRVYLKHVWSDDVDITWPMRGETGGIYKTHLMVTPYGRDFEYHANRGTLKNPAMPDLPVDRIHLLITKKVFRLYNLDLKSGEGNIHAQGSAATSGDKNLDFTFRWKDIPVQGWLPSAWRERVDGMASGDLRWTGNDFKMAVATMAGQVNITSGRVTKVKFLDALAAIAKKEDLANLQLNECHSKVQWHKSECELNDIVIEQTGKFRVEGTVSFSQQSLGGTLELGVAREYLAWLPNPEEVFPRRKGGYLWSTVHVSGSLQSPQNDLSPRLLAALKGSPGTLVGAALRGLGAWLRER
jgi:hypothetical protein